MWQSRCRHAEPVAGTAETLELYCTDDYAPYDTLLPVGRHYIGKDETVAIERVNSRLRHWFARFRPVWCRKRSRWSTPPSHCLPPITSIEQRQNSPCHWLLNTLISQGRARPHAAGLPFPPGAGDRWYPRLRLVSSPCRGIRALAVLQAALQPLGRYHQPPQGDPAPARTAPEPAHTGRARHALGALPSRPTGVRRSLGESEAVTGRLRL